MMKTLLCAHYSARHFGAYKTNEAVKHLPGALSASPSKSCWQVAHQPLLELKRRHFLRIPSWYWRAWILVSFSLCKVMIPPLEMWIQVCYVKEQYFSFPSTNTCLLKMHMLKLFHRNKALSSITTWSHPCTPTWLFVGLDIQSLCKYLNIYFMLSSGVTKMKTQNSWL